MFDYRNKTNWGQFASLIVVFFFWGFVAASNDILIPVFKKAFDLTNFQSQLVASAYYRLYGRHIIILSDFENFKIRCLKQNGI